MSRVPLYKEWRQRGLRFLAPSRYGPYPVQPTPPLVSVIPVRPRLVTPVVTGTPLSPFLYTYHNQGTERKVPGCTVREDSWTPGR